MTRRKCCPWWLPILLMVAFFFIVAALAKGPIESSLSSRARQALTAQGLDSIAVNASNWGDLGLTGPAADRERALAAVQGMRHRRDADHVTFRSTDVASPVTAATTTTAASTTSAASTTTAAPTTTSTTTTAASTTTVAATTTTAAAPTTTVAPATVDVTVNAAARTVTLTGFVASEAERAALVDAASSVFGTANVVDQLTVRSAAESPQIATAVAQLGEVIKAFGSRVETGQARLIDTTLIVSGTAFTKAAADGANFVVLAAKNAGLTTSGTIAAPAAPDPAQLQQRLRDLLGRSGINFESGSADITLESQVILDTAAQSILSIPGVNVQVGGHTDNVGSPAGNQTLSEQRANAVLGYLVGKGVPAAQLTAVGFGPTQPIADNTTADGRGSNRRIEFTVQGS